MTRQRLTGINQNIYYPSSELLDRLQRGRVCTLATPPPSFLQQLPARLTPADQSWTFQRTQLSQHVRCECAFCIVNPLPQMANYTEAPGVPTVRPQGYDRDQLCVQQTGVIPKESFVTIGITSLPPDKDPTQLIAHRQAINKPETGSVRPTAKSFVSFGGCPPSYATAPGPDSQTHATPPSLRGIRRLPPFSLGGPQALSTVQYLPLNQGYGRAKQYSGGSAGFTTGPHFLSGCNHVRHFPPSEDGSAAHSDWAAVRPFITQGQH